MKKPSAPHPYVLLLTSRNNQSNKYYQKLSRLLLTHSSLISSILPSVNLLQF